MLKSQNVLTHKSRYTNPILWTFLPKEVKFKCLQRGNHSLWKVEPSCVLQTHDHFRMDWCFPFLYYSYILGSDIWIQMELKASQDWKMSTIINSKQKLDLVITLCNNCGQGQRLLSKSQIFWLCKHIKKTIKILTKSVLLVMSNYNCQHAASAKSNLNLCARAVR